MSVVLNFTPFERQEEFLVSTEKRILYGGSAGGGKSAALVMKAFLYASTFKGAHVGLFRESIKQAKESLYYKWLEFIPEKDPKTGRRIWTWRASENQFIIEATGSRVSLNYMESYGDAQKYQGVEFDVIGIDELTKHDKMTIDFIITRLRSGKGYPTQFLGTSNPGSKGHLWVKKLFIDATDNGTKRVIKKVKNKFGKILQTSYRYIKSTLYDNPYLVGSDYEATLLEMPEHLQRMFLYGDWDIADGQFLTNFQPKEHIYEPGEITIESHWKCNLHMDWGHNDAFKVGFTFHDEDGFAFTDKVLQGNRMNLEDVCDEILKGISTYGFDLNIQGIVLPHDMFRQKDTYVRDGKGDIIGSTSAEIVETLTGLTILRAPTRPGVRVEGWRKVHRLMYFNRDKLEKQYEEGLIDFKDIRPKWRINSQCVETIEEIKTIVTDPNNPEDIQPNQEDHGVDMIRYYAITVFDNETSTRPKEKENKDCMAYVKKQLENKKGMQDLSPLYG